jgi:YtfJ family uncharacterized protein
MKSLAAAALGLFVSFAAQAATITVGAPVPQLSITDQGELIQKGDDIIFQPWDTSMLPGKVQVLQYLAARMTASKINEPFTDALREANFSPEKQVTTTVINTNDVMWGTTAFVKSELKSNKKKYPHARMIADSTGKGLDAWSLKKEGSAIAVLDKTGKVIFYKEGAMTAAEIKSTLTLIQSNL